MFTLNDKIATIAASNYKQVLLLEHLGIPLMVGEKSVQEICHEHHINPALYLCFASLFAKGRIPQTPLLNAYDVQVMVRYLQNSHRYYLTERIPQLQHYVQLLCQQNQSKGTQLLHQFVQNYIHDITEHFEYENKVVFEHILSLSNNHTTQSPYNVIDYKDQHDSINSTLADIKGLLVKYLPIAEEDTLRRKLLNCLFDLEQDLLIHSKIEDQLLIPLVEKLDPTTPQRPMSEATTPTKSAPDTLVLSERESAVLLLLLEGYANKEVADQLHISTHTVITHRKNICKKTGIKSLAGLTIYAIQNGLIEVNDLSSL